MVKITFECGRHERRLECDTPFDFIQVTYELVRGWRDDVEQEIAHWDSGKGDWYLSQKFEEENNVHSMSMDGHAWSDFIIVSHNVNER